MGGAHDTFSIRWCVHWHYRKRLRCPRFRHWHIEMAGPSPKMAKRFALTRKWIRRAKKLNAIEARPIWLWITFLHYLRRLHDDWIERLSRWITPEDIRKER
jgi:hypothetical protein